MTLWPEGPARRVLRPGEAARHSHHGRGRRGLAWRLLMLLGAALLSAGLIMGTATAAAAAPAVPQASGSGWIRLAHFSPNTPAVDVYLYSFGNSSAMIVLKHVSYGTVSPYEKVAAGEYTVAMRGAGAAASSAPVLSTAVMVHTGHAYTVAGVGPHSGLRLQVLDDRLTTPSGKALVRVIQASLTEHHVTVKAATETLASDLAFGSTSGYATADPGTWVVSAAGGGESCHRDVTLAAGSVHTLVVLDTASGLQINDLLDAEGSGVLPNGGAATGFGGTAPGPASSPLPWLAAIAGGLLVAAGGGYRVLRAGHRQHSRTEC